MGKVITAKIKEQLLKSESKTQICTGNSSYSTGYYFVNGKKSLNAAFNGLNLEEAINLLQESFHAAAKKLNVEPDTLRFTKGWRENVHIAGFREETDEEFEKRISLLANREAEHQRRLQKIEKIKVQKKKEQIAKLKKELEELESEQ